MSVKTFKFVPKNLYDSVYEIPQLSALLDFVNKSNKMCVLTGAGISTESNIPDYRSPGVGSYSKGHVPMTYQKFMASPQNRQNYYARNMFGFEIFRSKNPNRVHKMIADMDQVIQGIITQNVDGLHQKAGSNSVLELHGSNHEVICMSCHTISSRAEYQERLIHDNHSFYHETFEKLLNKSDLHRSDGDIDLTRLENIPDVSNFNVPECDKCGGIVKPNVVFFGENMPKERKLASEALVSESDALFVLGSSLQVFSSYRLITLANKLNIPIAIVTIGETRADTIENILKIEHNVGDVLEHIMCSVSKIENKTSTEL